MTIPGCGDWPRYSVLIQPTGKKPLEVVFRTDDKVLADRVFRSFAIIARTMGGIDEVVGHEIQLIQPDNEPTVACRQWRPGDPVPTL